MSAVLLCAALFVAAQTPAQRGARPPAAPARRDTIYVAVQSPPPTVVVKAPSQVLAVVLTVAGLLLLWRQMWIMGKQTDAMNRQTTLAEQQTALQDQQTQAMNRQTLLLDKQTALGEQQAEWQRAEALAALHRLLSDLAAELSHTVGVRASERVPVEANPHPRQLLRDAPRIFAPLGTSITVLLNEVGFGLDRYYDAVTGYNAGLLIPDVDVDVNLRAAVEWRKHIGAKMDKASAELRHLGLGEAPLDAPRPGATRSVETFEDMVAYVADRRAWVIRTRK